MVYGERYNFPVVDPCKCTQCGQCVRVCPSTFLLHGTDPGFEDVESDGQSECFLIHAKSDAVRVDAASGGFITALILHLMNEGRVDGAVVARCEGENPLVAESFIATDQKSLLSARGSKYAPVSSCIVLGEVLRRPGRYVFVGTPCMIEGLKKLQTGYRVLRERIVLTIGFVCAGIASRLSTRKYIEKDGQVDVRKVRRITYRGGGWPGRFRVYGENDTLLMDRPLIGGSLTHVVGRDHYLRCYNCLDHWGYFADIAVSDPWTAEMVEHEKRGWSAVMVRTDRGAAAVRPLLESSSVVAKIISVEEMFSYNKHLVIHPDHDRHFWMALYQLLYYGRVRHLGYLLRKLLQGRGVGIQTTTRARLAKRYYY